MKGKIVFRRLYKVESNILLHRVVGIILNRKMKKIMAESVTKCTRGEKLFSGGLS